AAAPAIIAFPAVEEARQAPIGLIGKAVELDRVLRARDPVGWRIPDGRASLGNLHGFVAQRVTVVKMRPEIEACFHGVDDADEVPRCAHLLGYLVVLPAIVGIRQLADMPGDL